MIFFDDAILRGLGFVLGEIASAVDAERDDVGSLRARLMQAQLRLESGEMTEGDFGALEGEIIARLSGLRAEEEQGPIEWASAEIEAVEVSSVPEKGTRQRQRFHRRNGP